MISSLNTSSAIHLIVVDCQHDFCHPQGALYVPKADQAVQHVAKLLKSGLVERVTFTLDWHPLDHCSFVTQGGQWPVHCVQHTRGAGLDEQLDLREMTALSPTFVTKGADRNREEYGAFSQPSPEELALLQTGNVVVCGIAGDYCVLETLKNVLKVCPDAQVFLEGIASIDGGESLNGFMAQHNVSTFQAKLS